MGSLHLPLGILSYVARGWCQERKKHAQTRTRAEVYTTCGASKGRAGAKWEAYLLNHAHKQAEVYEVGTDKQRVLGKRNDSLL